MQIIAQNLNLQNQEQDTYASRRNKSISSSVERSKSNGKNFNANKFIQNTKQGKLTFIEDRIARYGKGFSTLLQMSAQSPVDARGAT
jgi:hypothetical protein